MAEDGPRIGEEAIDSKSGRTVWWDGRGWSYTRPRGQQEAAPERKQLPVRALPRPAQIPLSFAQRRLWIVHQMQGASPEYNMPEALRLRGELNCEALRRTFNAIVARHEVLRTCFAEIEGEPVQVILPNLDINAPVEDFSILAADEQRERVAASILREWEESFDLRLAPLLRIRVLKLSEHEHILLRTFHHIICDGWSQGVFNRDFARLYGAFCLREENPLEPLPIQYADFALWQRAWLDDQVIERDLQYWRPQLAEIPEQLELPKDRLRGSQQTLAGGRCQALLQRQVVTVLQHFSRANQATLYMTLLAGLAVLLRIYSGEDDIVVGAPLANRSDPRFEQLIGFFVNPLPLCVNVSLKSSFRELLGQVRRTALDAFRHANVPFERLVEELAPERSLDTTPLFQVIFALQNAPAGVQQMQGLEVEQIRSERLTLRFDLEVYAWERNGELDFSFVYNRQFFDRWRIEQMARHYIALLEAAAKAPELPLYSLEIMTPQERRQLHEDFNSSLRPLLPPNVPAHFEMKVERSPGAAAVILGKECISYQDLNRRANQLARYLRKIGVGADTLVGIGMDRSVETIVALLAIVKAGGAYLPIAPELPAARREALIEDAALHLMITTQAQRPLFEPLIERVVTLDADTGSIECEDCANLSVFIDPLSAVYVNYTSGSSGIPKGVLVCHQSVVRLVHEPNYVRLNSESRLLQLAPLSFDAATFEIWGALLNGGSLVIMPPGHFTVEDVAKVVSSYEVNTLWLTAGLFQMVVDQALDHLGSVRQLLAGGDILSFETVKRVMEAHSHCQVINGYGPTECTTFTCCYPVSPTGQFNSGVPIGFPINYTQVYVADHELKLVPLGAPGELFVGGAGLARGYLNRPELTAERFVPDLFSNGAGERLYRTGDMVRWRRDGALEFLGRTDHQLKIRGFRIEPAEIEHALKNQEGVEDALVIAREAGAGGKQLLGYVVPARNTRVDGRHLLYALRERLPDYMVPAAIVILEAWPLTATGKIDRRALPLPEQSTGGYRAPRTPQEEILCDVFADILSIERVGIDDNFFNLGGHSLLATRLGSRIRETLGVELAVRSIFESPTVAGIALLLGNAERTRVPLVRQERPEHLPLSYAQQRLWFIDQFQGGSVEYNIPQAFRLRGELDRHALEQAVNAIVQRHEVLRTRLLEVEGRAVQVIVPEMRIRLLLEDLSGFSRAAQEQRLEAAMWQEREQPFDLTRGPLLRLKLLRLGEGEHVLLRTFHHIVFDGWSQGIFNWELSQLYGAMRAGLGDPLPPLGVQYGDFTLWQRQWLDEERVGRELGYWKEELAGIAGQLELPKDRARPARQTFTGLMQRGVLEGEGVAGVKRVGREGRATLYMVLLGAWAVLLERYSGQEEIVVGTPIANRQEAQLEGLIGFFVNSLVLRVEVKEGESFRELLGEVREKALGAYAHQDLPFERLVEELSPQRSLNTTPIYQVLFALQNAPGEITPLEGLEIEPVHGTSLRTRFDLELHALERGHEIDFYWVYNSDLFDAWRIEQLARHYLRLLKGVVSAVDSPLSFVQLLTDQERNQLLLQWNHSSSEPLVEHVLHRFFEQQAGRMPEALALVDKNRAVSYAQLNELSNKLARFLKKHGVGPEARVGIYLERSIQMIIALLATLKAGGAYVPLNPNGPSERLHFIAEDCGIAILLTQKKFREQITVPAERVLFMDEQREPFVQESGLNLSCSICGENSAYVIYTSGSTGKPKGVVVPHVAACNQVEWIRSEFPLAPGERVLQRTSLSFDVATEEIFSALSTGATLVLASAEVSQSINDLCASITQEHITFVDVTPSLLAAMLDTKEWLACASLKYVLCGSEPLPLELQERFRRTSNAQLYNLYGPTEATIQATSYKCLAVDGYRSVPMGRPITNVQAYVLDQNMEPVPIGIAGDLHIGGSGLARGYMNHPEWTAQSFVPDPFSSDGGTRLYRTGDSVRWKNDGNLEFLGRTDNQVKVRGYRIELEEVEAVFLEHPEVEEAAVVLLEDNIRGKRLAAYIVARDQQSVSSSMLRNYMRERLPDHMRPGQFHFVPGLPRGSNGKVDRQALAKVQTPDFDTSSSYVAPQSPVEHLLSKIWAELLGIERVGVDDNFFDVGGHSLLVIQLRLAIKQELDRTLPIVDFFTYPTIRSFAGHLERTQQKPPSVPDSKDRAERHREYLRRKTRVSSKSWDKETVR